MHILRSPILHYLLQRAAFFAALFGVWSLCYPDLITTYEEQAFWTDAPDLTHVMYSWPADWAPLASHYLAQFFARPLLGATILALLPLIVLLSADVVVWGLTHRRPLLCLSFLPAAAVALVCLRQPMLTLLLQCAAVALILALGAAWFALRKSKSSPAPLPAYLRITAAAAPYIITAAMCIWAATDGRQRSRQFTAHIEHLAERRQWAELLSLTYPERKSLDANLLSYSLLALSEQGQLGNKLFHYPVEGLESIFAHDRNFRFNSYFCHELQLPNEAIRYAFEESQYMPAGASFGTMRRMVDWILEKGDDPELAEFYLNILSHSTCHDAFIATRRLFMGQKPLKQREVEPEFVGSPSFLYEAALVLEREPDNQRARDYLLCGLLLTGNTEAFYDVFQRIYVETNDAHIPDHYYEALLALEKTHPEIDSSYNIPVSIEAAYRNFRSLAAKGEGGKAQAMKLYPHTYWAYLLRHAKTQQQGPQTEIKLSGTSHFD